MEVDNAAGYNITQGNTHIVVLCIFLGLISFKVWNLFLIGSNGALLLKLHCLA